jgi:hypothetical protein
MNYFAHGRQFVDDPYFLAGTAVPDWLIVADRGVKVRAKHAALFVDDENPVVRAVARGIAQHHFDDGWFHTTLAFHELSMELTARARASLPADGGFRASFLGHILVELLLDDVLIAECPARLDDYYRAIEGLDKLAVERAVNRIAPRPTGKLAGFIERFCAERFLWDYRDDARLLFRLNQVMRRANLPQLPEAFCELFPEAREHVRLHRVELLTPEKRIED